MARVPLVQQVVWGMVVVQGMAEVVVGGFKDFVDIVACFVVNLVATQNYDGASNSSYMY